MDGWVEIIQSVAALAILIGYLSAIVFSFSPSPGREDSQFIYQASHWVFLRPDRRVWMSGLVSIRDA